MLVLLHLLSQFFDKHFALGPIHGRAEVIEHEVVVEQHIKHQVAIILRQDLVLNHSELLLSLFEELDGLRLAAFHLCEGHRV